MMRFRLLGMAALAVACSLGAPALAQQATTTPWHLVPMDQWGPGECYRSPHATNYAAEPDRTPQRSDRPEYVAPKTPPFRHGQIVKHSSSWTHPQRVRSIEWNAADKDWRVTTYDGRHGRAESYTAVDLNHLDPDDYARIMAADALEAEKRRGHPVQLVALVDDPEAEPAKSKRLQQLRADLDPTTRAALDELAAEADEGLEALAAENKKLAKKIADLEKKLAVSACQCKVGEAVDGKTRIENLEVGRLTVRNPDSLGSITMEAKGGGTAVYMSGPRDQYLSLVNSQSQGAYVLTMRKNADISAAIGAASDGGFVQLGDVRKVDGEKRGGVEHFRPVDVRNLRLVTVPKLAPDPDDREAKAPALEDSHAVGYRQNPTNGDWEPVYAGKRANYQPNTRFAAHFKDELPPADDADYVWAEPGKVVPLEPGRNGKWVPYIDGPEWWKSRGYATREEWEQANYPFVN